MTDQWDDALAAADAAPSGRAILSECVAVAELLIAKNLAYGDSALTPMRVFSTADPAEQIRVRMDDKLSRIRNGTTDEDAIGDLLGYLILYRIATRRTHLEDTP